MKRDKDEKIDTTMSMDMNKHTERHKRYDISASTSITKLQELDNILNEKSTQKKIQDFYKKQLEDDLAIL